MGTTGVTAQAVGRDDRQAMLLVGLRNGLIALGLGLALLILQYPLPEVGFALLSAQPEIKASGEITSHIDTYAWGLIFLLAFASASTMLEGYFLGLAQGDIIRNVSLIASVVGFAPSAIAAWYFHNNHIFWLSVSLFLFAKTRLCWECI